MSDSISQNAFELFKTEIQSEEISVRVNTIHRVVLVAHLISNSQQLKELLLAQLNHLIEISDDEVIFGLAGRLADLTDHFTLQKLLPIFEKLLTFEETFVREKTVESFLKISIKLDRKDISQIVFAFILKLTNSQSFGTKMSVLAIILELFPVFNSDEKNIILEKINGNFGEESLILRRSIAGKLGKICPFLSREILIENIFNHFKNLSNDDSDSVRIITIESLVELARVFNVEDNKTYLVPLIIQLTGDKSWRVKHHLAKWFAELAFAVGKDISDNSLVSIFSTLLRDPENEVRTVSVQSLKKFVNCINPDKLPQILAYLQTLARDSISLVRTGVSEVIQVILQLDIPRNDQESSKARLLSILSDLCLDKDTENRIETMRVFPLWTRWEGSFLLEQIACGGLPIVTDSPNWRVRFAVLESFIRISIELNNPKLFDKFMRRIVVLGIHDKVLQIRKFVIKSLPALAVFLDDQIITDLFFKDYSKIAQDNSSFYTYRVSALYGLRTVIDVLKNNEKPKEHFLKILLNLADEHTVNLRYVALKILIKTASEKPHSEFMDTVRKHLLKIRTVEKDKETLFCIEEFFRLNSQSD